MCCSHKVRALRYRLLRRQLAEAAGLDCSPVATAVPSSLSLHASSSDQEHSSGGTCSEAGSPFLPTCTEPAESAGPAPISLPPGVIRVPAAAQASPARTQQPSVAAAAPVFGWDGQLGDEPGSEGPLPSTPLAAKRALAAAEAAAALPGALSCLADHLSDATPSSLASAAPASSAGPADSLVASSSCSTLHEVSSFLAGAAVRPSSSQLRQSTGRLGALQALKARTAGMRRTASQLAA